MIKDIGYPFKGWKGEAIAAGWLASVTKAPAMAPKAKASASITPSAACLTDGAALALAMGEGAATLIKRPLAPRFCGARLGLAGAGEIMARCGVMCLIYSSWRLVGESLPARGLTGR